MADISNSEYKVKTLVLANMMTRYFKYKVKYRKEPKIVYINKKENDNYITNAKFKDMVNRLKAFKAANRDKNPNYVWVNKPKTVPVIPPKPTNNWITVADFEQDYQDTGYTCADSSMQMAFSTLGYTVGEKWLAEVAGTTRKGTSHEQIFHAVQHVSEKVGHKFTVGHYRLPTLGGWLGVQSQIKNGGAIIIHIRTGALSKDANGKECWLHDYGHYVYLVGINVKESKVRIADPTKGVRDFTFVQLQKAIDAVSQPSFIMIKK